MERKIKISFKSFDKAINVFFRKRILKDPIRSQIVGKVNWIYETIQKLSKNYRSKPFKQKSSYRLSDDEPNKTSIKIGYIFENDKLYFKLLIKTSSRYVRLTQMVIKFQNNENIRN